MFPINATPIGMAREPEHTAVERRMVENCRAVLDVIVFPMESKVVGVASALGKAVAPGYAMSLPRGRFSSGIITASRHRWTFWNAASEDW